MVGSIEAASIVDEHENGDDDVDDDEDDALVESAAE